MANEKRKIDTNANTYTILYAVVIVVVVAFLLAFVSSALRSRQEVNVALDKKKQIQQAVRGIRMSEFADVQLSVSIGGICGVHPITEAIRKADYLMYLDKAEQKS